jgi:L-aminoadipate-semialdehyde dehydrogenase
VSEDDDMEGSAVGLGTGYGQSKWAGEHLVRAARARGLKAGIIRSGYILVSFKCRLTRVCQDTHCFK